MDICKGEMKAMKNYIFPRVRSSLRHIKVALNHMNSISKKLSYLIDNESNLSEMEREILYSYGLDRAKMHVMRLSNVKKSLELISPKGGSKK